MNKQNKINFSQHSLVRCQQRGIKGDVVEFIFNHGDYVNTHNDKKYFINKKKLKKLFFQNKDFIKKNDQSILNTAVIVNSNNIITAMKIHKNKKVRWH